ncbi:MAG: hypothetical protein IM549_07900 [Pseudanabaena sp. M53BS1SP1A06MG]|nr:hypothetical protein [Pseudanabaena sp. M53BS1SP1A06MG]
MRDVLFQEDTGLRRGGNATTIWAIIHCFIVTTQAGDLGRNGFQETLV